jgi:hypothetical protein
MDRARHVGIVPIIDSTRTLARAVLREATRRAPA